MQLATAKSLVMTCAFLSLLACGPTHAVTDFNGDGIADLGFHLPGSNSNRMRTLLSLGDGTWFARSDSVPRWPNRTGTRALHGDFDGDGLTDVAFQQTKYPWQTVPVLFSEGLGQFTPTNESAPSWAHGRFTVPVVGDYNGDGRSDIAVYRPRGGWDAVRVLLADGNGGWTPVNGATPSWTDQPGVIAIPGDFNGDGLADLAFHRPGSHWGSVPMLIANGDGTWTSHNQAAPGWANQPGVRAIPGDFDNDGLSDIAFQRPGSHWGSIPVLFSDGDGSWSHTNEAAQGANEFDVHLVAGDFNGDGNTDLFYHRPGTNRSIVRVLLADGGGSWTRVNSATSWRLNSTNVRAIADDFNGDGVDDLAFHKPRGSSGRIVPAFLLFSDGAGKFPGLGGGGVPSWVTAGATEAIGGGTLQSNTVAADDIRHETFVEWCARTPGCFDWVLNLN